LKKLLTVAATGLVGSKVASRAINQEFETYHTNNTLDSNFPRTFNLDIRDREATMRLVSKIRPHIIINAAALTNVDYCETHKKEAEDVNTRGVKNLADAALINKSRLIQISTDSVFDGAYGHYAESDTPHPINHYSATKLEAENIVSQLPDYAIARPSAIYGWHSRKSAGSSGSTKAMNFAMYVLDRLKTNLSVRAIRDQYNSPTFADNLAEALLNLARRNESGIFHVAGRSCLSRYEFALKIAQTFGYKTELIHPVFASEFDQVAIRPKNCCLRVEKAERTLRMRFLSVDEGIRQMKVQAASINEF